LLSRQQYHEGGLGIGIRHQLEVLLLLLLLLIRPDLQLLFLLLLRCQICCAARLYGLDLGLDDVLKILGN
jgi:hypothetical protein